VEEWVLTPGQYQTLWNGLQVTLRLLVLAFLLGVVLSLVFGVGRLSDREWVRAISLVYVEFARGISSIILLFTMVFAIPILLDFDAFGRFGFAVIALGINMGGYGAEIVRGSINAIPKGQTEASVALNLSPTQRLRHVVLPQAMRIILPPMGNLTIEILKGTALVALVAISDLMQATRNLIQQQLADGVSGVTVLFVNVLVIYFIVAQIINGLFRLAEWRLDRRFEQRRGRAAAELPEHVASTSGAGG
jgi:polar amino acid transport system permease protein